MNKLITAAVLISTVLMMAGCSKKKEEVKPYRVGLVNFTVGKVFIVGAGGKEFPARIGLPVDEGMKIRTVGKASMCELYIKDTAVKVFGDTVLDFDRIGYDKARKGEQTVMTLENGRMFARVAKKLSADDRFAVKTQTVVAAVRGTDFFVSRSKTGSSVSCLDGKMEVREKSSADKKPVVINNGEKADAPKGKNLASAEIAKDAQKNLSKEAEVRPVEKTNSDLFERLDKNDTSALNSLRGKIKELSGAEVKKEKSAEKPDIDLFFFKS